MTIPVRITGQGRLDLEFASDGEGRSFLGRQYASYPFHVCKAQYLDADEPNLATLYTQSCSGGLYEGDDLNAGVLMRPGAQAHVTTQASTIIHSMTGGMARQTTRIVAEGDSYLEFLPDPQILFARSNFSSTISVTAADTATVVVSDALLAHDPAASGGAPSSYSSTVLIEDSHGRRLAADRLTLTSEAFLKPRPGVLGKYKAQGTLFIITRDPKAGIILADIKEFDGKLARTAIGFTQLPNDAGHLCRVLAHDGASLKRAMQSVWNTVRLTLRGHSPTVRRK